MTVAQRVPESSIAGRVAVFFAQALQESLQILQDSRRARELGLRLTPRGFGGWLSLGGVRQAFDRLATQGRALAAQEFVTVLASASRPLQKIEGFATPARMLR